MKDNVRVMPNLFQHKIFKIHQLWRDAETSLTCPESYLFPDNLRKQVLCFICLIAPYISSFLI